MCISPSQLPDGTLVACRHCALCQRNRVDDLVGRCLAEADTATRAFSVTLTYSGNGPETVVLRYSDVQLFLKRLRKDGFKVRYICAGEYGSKSGRAHWHIVLFFYGKIPDVDLNTRFDWSYWPHGFSYFQSPDEGGMRYVLKYALKDQDKSGVRRLSMSKKPPLGYDFFMRLADDIVERGLPVRSPSYAFSSSVKKGGVAREYWLQGRMRELFLDRYQLMWGLVHGGEPPQSDFYVEGYADKVEAARSHVWRQSHRFDPLPGYEPPDVAAVDVTPHIDFCGILRFDHLKGGVMLFAFVNETADLEIGGQTWTVQSAALETVEVQLHKGGLTKSDAQRASIWLAKKWQSPRRYGA